MARPFDKRRADIKHAVELGWEYCGINKGGHLAFVHPATTFKLTLPCTPSDHRTIKNGVSWINRMTPRED